MPAPHQSDINDGEIVLSQNTYNLLLRYMDSKFSSIEGQIEEIKADFTKLSIPSLEKRITSVEQHLGIYKWVGGGLGGLLLAIAGGMAANSNLLHLPGK